MCYEHIIRSWPLEIQSPKIPQSALARWQPSTMDHQGSSGVSPKDSGAMRANFTFSLRLKTWDRQSEGPFLVSGSPQAFNRLGKVTNWLSQSCGSIVDPCYRQTQKGIEFGYVSGPRAHSHWSIKLITAVSNGGDFTFPCHVDEYLDNMDLYTLW